MGSVMPELVVNGCQSTFDSAGWIYLQVRDTALGIDTTDSIPKSDVNREYFAEEHDRKVRDCFQHSCMRQELSRVKLSVS